MADKKKQKWMLTHDSHELKRGAIFEGNSLPLWLSGKAIPVSEQVLEVATPDSEAVAKLQTELDEANSKVTTLTASNAKLQTELDEAQKQLAELQKKVK
ncbi:hypothetical protein [Dickeya fangzhongdai]|uniref:Uncharacterized protein n=1 Tax=Dickeya fangzhongdai TaxID=1778540 RepID=A0A2K8QP55_9GAMM|nr:hypothetical protein [Dickeya fangzhongdai]ATZ95297.1 hypothetical protein CVE23_15710 [Dickeya fangzhongdai]QOH48738.1 hypothetical protein DYD82_15775 [Dickeya fangzhongdai]QOH53042.1 hypothetical protein DYD83_15775 [Dickeya fangzhongdai]GGC04291.1 hypothetical protein GCM10007171_21710 [Dickeya fangzhongdai]